MTENKDTDNIIEGIDYPEPNFIIEDVYGGPDPDLFYPSNDPIECVYGPPEPEPDLFPETDTDDTDEEGNKFPWLNKLFRRKKK